jgi:dihydroorotase-like cyclic amidohydrolase
MATAVLTFMVVLFGCHQVIAQPTNQPPTDSIAKLQRLIAPAAGESQWMQVPWMPSSNIYAARKKAAEEGKPLLLWYMAGEPLGTC